VINLRHTLAEVARVIVGLVFVGSGFLKAVDPVGTALKISQYLTPILSPAAAGAETLTLALSFVLCGSEFLLGAFLLMGVYRKFCARLSVLFMLVMTAVTLYTLIANPISDCGCFGDAIQLTHPDSDQNAAMEMFYGFPPSSVAVFEVPGEWALLDGADAHLIAFKSF